MQISYFHLLINADLFFKVSAQRPVKRLP